MKRVAAALVAVTLGLTACGGDDDTNEAEASAESTGAGTTETAADTGSDDADESPATVADDGSDDESTGGDDAAADTDGDDTGEDPAAGGDDGGSITSLSDIPQECQDVMAEFLRDIEPIVEGVDWNAATLTDFESIAAEFETRAGEFDARATDAGCDDLDIADEDGFDLLVEFANQEAPGTAPFFEFLAGFAGAFADDDPDAEGDSGTAAPAGEFETCDDAIAFVEGLIDEYDGYEEVPVSEITKFSSISTVLMTCTPEQMAILDSDEFNEFMGGG